MGDRHPRRGQRQHESGVLTNPATAKVELGFQRPARLQAYAAPPIRVTQELQGARPSPSPSRGVYIFDLGQNFAGIDPPEGQGPGRHAGCRSATAKCCTPTAG